MCKDNMQNYNVRVTQAYTNFSTNNNLKQRVITIERPNYFKTISCIKPAEFNKAFHRPRSSRPRCTWA